MSLRKVHCNFSHANILYTLSESNMDTVSQWAWWTKKQVKGDDHRASSRQVVLACPALEPTASTDVQLRPHPACTCRQRLQTRDSREQGASTCSTALTRANHSKCRRQCKEQCQLLGGSAPLYLQRPAGRSPPANPCNRGICPSRTSPSHTVAAPLLYNNCAGLQHTHNP